MDIQPPKHPHSDLPPQPIGVPLPASKPTDGPAKQPGWRSRLPHGWPPVISTIALLTSALALAFLIAHFGLQSYQVDGQSMESTLQNDDRLIVDKIPRTWSRITHHAYIPNRGDIIVFNQGGLFDASGKVQKQLIKRVIGLPGEHVVVKDGKITVYNAANPNGFEPDTAGGYKITQPTFRIGNYSDVTLKANQIFVCGDNRGNSEDSRAFGPVNAKQIVGQLVLRIIPLGKAQRF